MTVSRSAELNGIACRRIVVGGAERGQNFAILLCYTCVVVRGLVLGLGLGISKVIQTAKKLTSQKVFREVLAYP